MSKPRQPAPHEKRHVDPLAPSEADPTAAAEVTIALIGNPNTGKSTLFNALSGVRQRVGNYPGVTVEKKIGRTRLESLEFTIIDLPGTYSLAPRSPDEMVAVDVLLGRRGDVDPPDVVLCIVDASNLERNLYLVSQVLELRRPTVIALNMVDIAREKGVTIDVELLRQRMRLPILEIQANRQLGVKQLKQTLARASQHDAPSFSSPFPDVFQREVAALEESLQAAGDSWPRYLVERLLLDTGGYLEQRGEIETSIMRQVVEARGRLAEAGYAAPGVEAISRYQWVGEILEGVVSRPHEPPATLSDRIDRVLTHRIWGSLVFVLLMMAMFQSIFSWASPITDLIDGWVGGLGELVGGAMPEGALRSLIVNGAIAGVGGVLVFLPQIFILFLFIAVLEDCGYMARAAYLMDKLMSRVGLSGKSFIPLLSSFACAIPGIMATRVIENRRDRLATMLIAPLMSCSARLPVYVLLTAAFIPDKRMRGVTMFSMYLIGILAAVAMAFLLKRTLLRGDTPPFVMELPGYKFPSLRNVLTRMLERGWSFVRRAGTLIFAVSVLVWAAAYFPHGADVELRVRAAHREQLEAIRGEVARAEDALTAAGGEAGADQHNAVADTQRRLAELQATIENQVAGAYIEQSYLGRMGKVIEPVVKPLGWDWRIGCAVIASFPAREVVIGTMGVIYQLGEGQDEQSGTLRQHLRTVTWPDTGKPVFNIPVALSLMVFFALCAQCAATLAVMRRETNSWRWPAFTFAYMTVLAYVGAFLTYRVGMWIMGA